MVTENQLNVYCKPEKQPRTLEEMYHKALSRLSNITLRDQLSEDYRKIKINEFDYDDPVCFFYEGCVKWYHDKEKMTYLMSDDELEEFNRTIKGA